MQYKSRTQDTVTEIPPAARYFMSSLYITPVTISELLPQRALYNLGLTSIPIINVNNNCSTGSAAVYQANNAVKYGQVECALALGFERMKPGSLGTNFPDRVPPMMILHHKSEEIELAELGKNHGPGAPRMFSNGAQEYFVKHGGGIEHLAKIGALALRNIHRLDPDLTCQRQRTTSTL
jgi:acetyl-CoA acetyltransferase